MKKTIGILTLITVLFACNRNETFEERGDLIIMNNSRAAVFTEIFEFGTLAASDSIQAGENLELNFNSGHKKVLIYESDNEPIIRDLTVFAQTNNTISVLSDKTVNILNNQDFPIYFYYQKSMSDQGPLEKDWLAYELDNQPKLIKAVITSTINFPEA